MFPRTDIVERIENLTAHEQKNLVAALRELLDSAYNSAEVYFTAARAVRDTELQDLFRSFAEDRRDAVSTLRTILAELGVNTGPHPSISGELHQTLIAFRGAVEHGDPAAILAECERGEHFALGRYERALKLRMPMRIATFLLDQAALVRSAHRAFERMRHGW